VQGFSRTIRVAAPTPMLVISSCPTPPLTCLGQGCINNLYFHVPCEGMSSLSSKNPCPDL
jgi:hypothetical protein